MLEIFSDNESGLATAIGRTPLHLAVYHGSVELAACLLNMVDRTNINIQDEVGDWLLHVALQSVKAGKTSLDMISVILSRPDLDLMCVDSEGCTAFHRALKLKLIDAARLIYQHESKVANKCDSTGLNVLHHALISKDVETVFMLLQIGLDVNAKTNNSELQTPLHLAVEAGNSEDILRSLFLAGALVNELNARKQTALHSAVIHDRPWLIKSLMEAGVIANSADAYKNTALHLAVNHGSLLCLEALFLNAEVEIESKNVRGQTPVHMLALSEVNKRMGSSHSTSSIGMSASLLSSPQLGRKGMSPAGSVVSLTPVTTLLLAFKADNLELCNALIEHGVPLGTLSFDGTSIFTKSLATNYGRPAKLLFKIFGK
ncbi:Ankyrin repeat and FYVE domain-containing protein 1 [Cichlidogyrus casuarinus]|uniref:Ankyrin repeat and FYVE domain-containing protein 1 n=1 Tax=Cichlidogyrus casuarinus TaxID=1844966 RepID=A0ABD2QE05_9PLAT